MLGEHVYVTDKWRCLSKDMPNKEITLIYIALHIMYFL